MFNSVNTEIYRRSRRTNWFSSDAQSIIAAGQITNPFCHRISEMAVRLGMRTGVAAAVSHRGEWAPLQGENGENMSNIYITFLSL